MVSIHLQECFSLFPIRNVQGLIRKSQVFQPPRLCCSISHYVLQLFSCTQNTRFRSYPVTILYVSSLRFALYY
nr:MAG TPA: hypothetical protein [Caudoviricetes sp.]